MGQYSESTWSFTYAPKCVNVSLESKDRAIRLRWKMVAAIGLGYMCAHLGTTIFQFFGFLP